ncbi:heavy metal transporter, partial [Streptomyces sp. NPDC001139]
NCPSRSAPRRSSPRSRTSSARRRSRASPTSRSDRDSLGLFQQRPSQGWGTQKQILDPTYAANIFYEHLAKVPDYTKLPLTVAAQRVQRSGFPEAYAKHEPDAALLAAALTGSSPATLTCQGRVDATTVRAAGPDAVRAALVRDFGRDVLQPAGAEVGGGTSASSPAPGAGARTVTLPVAAGTSPAKGRSAERRGWQLAHWAVANATALHIERVSFGGREWVAGNTDSQWRTTGAQGGDRPEKDTEAVRIVTGQ